MCPTLLVVDNRYWEHTTGGAAGDDVDSASVLVWLFGWMLRRRLHGFEDDSQDQRGAEQILQIDDAVDCTDSLDPPA